MPDPILIATRKSPLALKQAEMACEWLEERFPEDSYQALPLSTEVDKRLDWSLEKRGGSGLFTKELEVALLTDKAALAVHSAKDMPTTLPKDLPIAGYLPRGRVNDRLVRRNGIECPKRIATGSPRRRAQFTRLRPDAEWTTIRGNVGTRLRAIMEGEVADATLLAAAGIDRLNLGSHKGLEFVELPVKEIVPAPGQAAIAIQCHRKNLDKYRDSFCPKTGLAVNLEREFLRRLGGGCQTPIGAYYDGGVFHIYHPNVGYAAYESALTEIIEIDEFLSTTLNDLRL